MAATPLLLNLTRIAHERFRASAIDANGASLAQNDFDWRTETVGFEDDLKHIEALALLPAPDATFHIEYGKRLYGAVFSRALGELLRARLSAEPDASVPILIRVEPSAQALSRLPWELLHDGHAFLVSDARTPIARLPAGVSPRSWPPVAGGLRMLFVVSNPDDLPENKRLDPERERELILAATEKLQREGRLDVVFLEDASLDSTVDTLAEGEFHLLHFSGHGNFDEATRQGGLLLEDDDGRSQWVSGAELADTLRGSGLRAVVVSACRTATPAQEAALRDVGSQLAVAGFPISLAMQFSVADGAATDFAARLYRALCTGQDWHSALTRARTALLTPQMGPAAFATPVAFVADPLVLRVDRSSAPLARESHGPVDFGLVPRIERGFVGRSREQRRLRRQLASGAWRAAVIYGIGGIGKSALAGRVATRLLENGAIRGIKVVNCRPTLTTDNVLSELGAFLSLAGETRFNSVIHQPVPLQAKTAELARLLESQRLLILFDNVEDCLIEGAMVSRAVSQDSELEAATGRVFHDADLERCIAQLVGSVAQGTRFLFTSRVDFAPLEEGRLGDAIGHIGLGELPFVTAAQLMNRHEKLAALPISLRDDAAPNALSKRRLYAELGGHPWALDQFARLAERAEIAGALKGLSGLKGELLAFTLVTQAIGQLSPRAALLLRRAAIYDEPVPMEGLAYLLGDARDAMPAVSAEVEALVGWGLMAYEETMDGDTAERAYAVHTLVRDWARQQMTNEERTALQCTAAEYWLAVGRDSTSLTPELTAHNYLFEVGAYERAHDIVQGAHDYLRRWGQLELLLRLLNESVRTLTGNRRAVALANLANVYQLLGAYKEARRILEAVLAEFEASGLQQQVATTLYHLGNLHYLQAEYAQARERYEKALAIFEALGDRAAIASSRGQLGILHLRLGEYGQARERYEQTLAIFEALGDRVGIAACLHQLGTLHQLQGEYVLGRERTERALAIKRELGDRAGIANSLGQLAVLHRLQGEYVRARERAEQALAIERKLGDRAGIATSLQELGNLHYLQGEYARARERYEQSLAIKKELGDRVGTASSLGQMGLLSEAQGDLPAAVRYSAQALAIFTHLRAPERNFSQSALARLQGQMGSEEFERALQDAGISDIRTSGSDEDEASAPEGMTVERTLDLIVANTVAVLTTAKAHRDEWWKALCQLEREAREMNIDPLARFAGLARKLVEGAKPPSLEAEVPDEVRDRWVSILKRSGLAS